MKELLFSVTKDDFDISFFSGTGAGGQHRNKHMNCVRMKHRATGVTGTGQNERSLEQNKRQAFRTIVDNPKFQAWLKIETSKALLTKEERRKLEEKILANVEKQMAEENLKIETF